MTTYYRDGSVWVTDEWIEIGRRRLRIADLTYVWHQLGRPTARTTSRLMARWGLIGLLTVPVITGAVLLANLMASAYGVVAIAGVAVLLSAAGLSMIMVILSPVVEFPLMALERSYDRGVAVREIWVQWQGREVLLLRSSDAARFGKIYRAIERAIERNEP